MNIVIRKETPQDYKRVEYLAREAFWNLYIPGAQEHYIVKRLHENGEYMKELTFVAEIDNIVQAAIFYTKAEIIKDGEKVMDAISFGPVFVSPELHRQGIGRKLITHSIQVAKKLGHKVIMTLGYPYHYKPYGFCGGKNYRIGFEDGSFPSGLLVLPLVPNVLDNIAGWAKFTNALECELEESEAYDVQLPYKEKLVLPSQVEYAQAVQMMD